MYKCNINLNNTFYIPFPYAGKIKHKKQIFHNFPIMNYWSFGDELLFNIRFVHFAHITSKAVKIGVKHKCKL